jgi:hypothetical protein
MHTENRIDPVYQYVDAKFRALKTATTKLRKRIEYLEILGLQEQITSLDSQIKKLDSSLLTLEQDIAHLLIHHNLLWALWVLTPKLPNTDAMYCIQFVRESATVALTQVLTSGNPLKVASDWYYRCADYFHKHGGFEIFV